MTSKYIIQKNVPIPATHSRIKRELTSVMEQMEVNDYLFISEQDISGRKVRTTANNLKNHKGLKFTTRLDKENGGTGVWRIA